MVAPPSSLRERILDAAQRLVLERGFTATTVDAVLETAGASKGAFFHHFPTKASLGRALVERYAAGDAEVLETLMQKAEADSDDPAEQVIGFVRAFEGTAEELALSQPGCLFVSFIYEHMPSSQDVNDIIVGSIRLWRERILEKLRQAAQAHPPAVHVDLPSLADQVSTIFEGAFILARATEDPGYLRTQLSHLRHYLELLFEADAPHARHR
ncbi:MAG TPA: TetR/AcrR family transcriptional regulator [Actinomycetota bacterium]|jgi:TetR/AcrR family transcriptional repressor of nem operon|nr:TetR/AcrR family transcriptional regulator [Actinomycetota bacterium]